MTRNVVHVAQGSPEWLRLRASHFCSSDAPAMMGCSPFMSRAELLRAKVFGVEREHDESTARLFRKGHETEAQFRQHAEKMAGHELFPAVMTLRIDDLPLLASLDGMSMDGSLVWEHKLFNDEGVKYLREHGEPPLHYVWQIEHQLLVSGAESALFTYSDGTPERVASVVYRSRPERRRALLEGWQQFARDMRDPKTLEQLKAEPSPKPVGRSPETLPALRIEVTGRVVASNLEQWRDHALSVIREIPRDLQTDQQFADAERTVKWCSEIEDRLKAAKQAALAQAAEIDALFRAVDEVAEELRRTRLDLDRQVKARKDAIRVEIIQEAMAMLREQVARASAHLGQHAPRVPADAQSRIAEAMRGKKTVETLRMAAANERAAIAAHMSGVIARVTANVATAERLDRETALGHLWKYDLQALAELTEPQEFASILHGRIAEHQKEQERAARLAAEAKARAEQAAAVAAVATAEVAVAEEPAARPVRLVRIGEINAMIAPLSVTADGLASLGVMPVKVEKAAKLYDARDVRAVLERCAKMIAAKAAELR